MSRERALQEGVWMDYRCLVQFGLENCSQRLLPGVRRSEQRTKRACKWGYLSNVPRVSMEA